MVFLLNFRWNLVGGVVVISVVVSIKKLKIKHIEERVEVGKKKRKERKREGK